jgi:hypothetical protein
MILTQFLKILKFTYTIYFLFYTKFDEIYKKKYTVTFKLNTMVDRILCNQLTSLTLEWYYSSRLTLGITLGDYILNHWPTVTIEK